MPDLCRTGWLGKDSKEAIVEAVVETLLNLR